MPRQIAELRIEKLFGYLNHAIPLPTDERFTILFGANGVGKTTVLRILESILSGRFVDLFEIPFGRIIARFDDGSAFIAEKPAAPLESSDNPELHIQFWDASTGRPIDETLRRASRMRPALRNWLLRETTWRPIERGLWEDESDGEILDEASLASLVEGTRGAARSRPDAERNKGSEQLFHVLDVSPPLSILTERLGTREVNSRAGRMRATETVSRYSEEIRATVTQAFTEDAVLSQELDQTFPSRLLGSDELATPSETEIRTLYDSQSMRRAMLREVGLISSRMANISLPSGDIADWKLRTLALFLDDANRRLDQFESHLARFSLFYRMMNSRFLGKRLVISESGLRVIMDETGGELPLTRLSSGEQHELILTYSLIFHTQPGQLVLIDEPELSLHAVWQQQFLADLTHIFELTGARAVIATHSPMIVDRWTRRMVELSIRGGNAGSGERPDDSQSVSNVEGY